jgi:uncharacterized protein YjiK
MRFVYLFIVFQLLSSCGKADSEYFEFLYQIKLNKELKEISGLALDRDGNLIAHDDEKGIVYKLDIKSGEILSKIELEGIPKGDFEGIAFVNDYCYMVKSNGTIFKFKTDKQKVSYEIIDTGLKSNNDVEGLCYFEDKNALLLACKEKSGLDEKHIRTVYLFDLKEKRLDKKNPIKISIKQIKRLTNRSNFNPSGIEYCKSNNSLYIIDGKNISIAIIDEAGKIKNAFPLEKDLHKQPEGITFKNNLLIISDEGKKGKATLTIYRML